jgi:hypothetical protein
MGCQHHEVLTFPDSELAAQAETYLRDTSPKHLVNHCLRSYLWAVAVGEIERVTFDADLLFVAAALHDLGLLDPFDKGHPFEVDGGAAAADFTLARGRTRRDAQVVREAVEWHVARDLVADDGPEAYLLWHGTGVDVSGDRVGDLDGDLVAEVLARFPRHDFQIGFAELFRRQAETKPTSRAAELVSGGLLGRLASCPLDERDATS